jgi:L-galactose dehydrogenase
MIEKRAFSQTGEMVTVLGLGGGALNKRSFEAGVATVHRALELGITYFDTSPLYGNGVSQAVLGEALQGVTVPYFLATKVGHFPSTGNFRSIESLRAQIAENLRILRRTSVDLLQIHECDWQCWWSDQSQPDELLRSDLNYDFAGAPVLRALREAQERGLCRYIGITGNNANVTARVLEQVDVDAYLVAFNYDLIWRGARLKAISVARRKGVALILGAPFHEERLTKAHPEWLASPPVWMTAEIQSRFEKLYSLQRDCGLSLVALSIRFLLADPSITTILVGAASPDEIEESVAAVQAGPLPSELQKTIEDLGLPE